LICSFLTKTPVNATLFWDWTLRNFFLFFCCAHNSTISFYLIRYNKLFLLFYIGLLRKTTSHACCVTLEARYLRHDKSARCRVMCRACLSPIRRLWFSRHFYTDRQGARVRDKATQHRLDWPKHKIPSTQTSRELRVLQKNWKVERAGWWESTHFSLMRFAVNSHFKQAKKSK